MRIRSNLGVIGNTQSVTVLSKGIISSMGDYTPAKAVSAWPGFLTPYGQQAYTTPGTYSWTCPNSVSSVSVVCIGGGGSGGAAYYAGGGGGGGGLGWKNNISVTPGQTYTVVVGSGGSAVSATNGGQGTSGGDSYFIDATTVKGGGGGAGTGTSSLTNTSYAGGSGGTYVGDGGGNGGAGGTSSGDSASTFTNTVSLGMSAKARGDDAIAIGHLAMVNATNGLGEIGRAHV